MQMKKILGILLAICFLMSVTAAAVSAGGSDFKKVEKKEGHKENHKENHKEKGHWEHVKIKHVEWKWHHGHKVKVVWYSWKWVWVPNHHYR